MAAVEALAPDAVALTPSYALHLAEWAEARGIDLAGSSVARLLVAGEPGGGEPELRARLEAAWGARVTEAMGIGDIAVSLWGECEAQGGMHFSGRGFVHVELIDPETGARAPARGRRRGRARLYPPRASARRRCCASAAATTCASPPAAAPAAAPRRGSAASAAPTTC